MRLLPGRHDPDRGSAAAANPPAVGRADRRGHVGSGLPGRHISAHPEGDPRGCASAAAMNTRRDFLRMTGVAALAIGFRWPEPHDVEETAFKPNAWISIQPDGRILFTVGKTEMGQGVRTSLPMILADEIGADLTKIDLVQASPGKDFTQLGTGGSWSVGGSWKTLRTAGAAAREMLIAAAAARWSVDPAR